MFVRKLDDSFSTEKGYVVVPSIMETDMESGYLEDTPPMMLSTEELGYLCETIPNGNENAAKGSLERRRTDDPMHEYILRPFHVQPETFSARTNNVIKWRKENGFSIWRTS